jgi:uncharacterized protein YndB with AHSA1/START domain
MSANAPTDESAFDLEISRTLKAPRALLWKAWTTKELIEEWWCPKPWKAEFTAFEPRPGGAFNSIFRGPNGEEHIYEGSILEIAPMQRIVFTDLLGGGWRPLAGPFLGFTAIIAMADEGAGVRYTARVRHKCAEDAKKHAEMGFHDGWAAAIAQLEEVAAKL